MKRYGSPSAVLASISLVVLSGCASVVNVLGVYFPGWLVAFTVAVVFSYAFVIWLGKRPSGKELADSGLFFVGLVATVALAVWWVCFGRLH